MIYVTSDLHIGHDKEFLYSPRGFNSIKEHDEALVNSYNSIVTDEDDVYILGDLMLNDIEYGIEVLKQLKGRIHIITGNHDTTTKVLRYHDISNVIDIQYATVIKYKKRLFYLSHYPTYTSNNEKRLSQCVINLHGHTHSKDKYFEDKFYMYNVSLDAHDMKIVSIDEIINDIKEKYNEENCR